MSTKSQPEDLAKVKLEQVQAGRYSLSGPLTFVSIPKLLEAKNIFTHAKQITIDLQHVTHSDSASAALLIEWLRQAKQAHSDLNFINIPAQIIAILRVSGLEGLPGIQLPEQP
jgi:ABC-type transporter Mla MlaB component